MEKSCLELIQFITIKELRSHNQVPCTCMELKVVPTAHSKDTKPHPITERAKEWERHNFLELGKDVMYSHVSWFVEHYQNTCSQTQSSKVVVVLVAMQTLIKIQGKLLAKLFLTHWTIGHGISCLVNSSKNLTGREMSKFYTLHSTCGNHYNYMYMHAPPPSTPNTRLPVD